jgi:methylated-DNA-protein-cysteine methyltransferase related protein
MTGQAKDPPLSFHERVASVVSQIPAGRVTTYGRIARGLGAPRSARMVGWVLSNLPSGHNLPAHRVVNHVGFLSGAEAWGNPEIMRTLLLDEGVPFREEWVVDLDACLWDPADEPELDALFRVRD